MILLFTSAITSAFGKCRRELDCMSLTIGVSNEQFLAQGNCVVRASAPYATHCPIFNGMFMFLVYCIIHQLLWSKIDFFLQN